MSYVLKRSSDGAYVAPSGSPSSYTRALPHARIYPTREAADADRCPGNETIYAVAEELKGANR